MKTKHLFFSLGNLNWIPGLLLTLAVTISVTYRLVQRTLDPFGGILLLTPGPYDLVIASIAFVCAWYACSQLFLARLSESGVVFALVAMILTVAGIATASIYISPYIAIHLLTP